MVNKKLADWIKDEEFQGHSEEELVVILKKNGIKEDDINKAVLYLKQKFHKEAILHIPLYLIILSSLSLLFLGFVFGEFLRSITLLALIVFSIQMIDFLAKKDMDVVNWTYFIAVYVFFLVISPKFFLIAVVSLIIAIIVFFREKKMVNLYLITITTLISTLISLTIAFLLYLFIVYVFISNLPIMNLLYLILFFLPIIYIIPPLVYFLNNLALEKIRLNEEKSK